MSFLTHFLLYTQKTTEKISVGEIVKYQGRGLFYSVGLVFFSLLAACAPQGSPLVAEMSEKAVDNLGCSSLQSVTFDELYKIAENQKTWPTSEELLTQLKAKWQSDARSKKINKAEMDAFFKHYASVLDTIKQRLPADWANVPREQRLGLLASIELDNNSTLYKQKMNEVFKGNWQKVEDAQSSMKTYCSNPQHLVDFKNEDYPEIYGSRKVFATAYQGCSALDLDPMDDSTPNLKGITIIGTHPAGGYLRSITDLQSAYKTHYYVSHQQPDSKCQDLSRTPLIYDFGGKPYATANDQSTLNFFRDAGSGTSVLGVDCGGYVFSALMAGGLRLRANVPIKAVHIYDISANMNPASYGYSCFNNILVDKDFEMTAGDIISTPGHILMIDEVGDDPLGIADISRVEDCRDGVIKTDKFNFLISQSSPSKGAIGMNRILASTYMKEASTYRTGFMNYAVAACKAKFGVKVAVDHSSFWWLRHKKTPECRQNEINLEKQECIASCL